MATVGEKRSLTPAQSRVLALLAVSVLINYVDRGNLSIAAPLLKDELQLSASQLGILLSAFFWTYASCQILAGWLVDRYDANWIMAAGFALWSTATAGTGLVHGFAMLLALRLVLGIGESVAYPSYSRILVRHIPEHHRGLANSMISAGLVAGPAVSTFIGGMLVARMGWRLFFIGLGLICLLWLLPWIRWMPRGAGIAPAKVSGGPGIPDILKQRSCWGTCLALFCSNYLSYFLLAWLPFYLVRERHFSLETMAKIGGLAYLLAAMFSTATGWFSDRWIDAGGTPTRVRKSVVVTGHVCAGIAIAGCVVAGRSLSVVLLVTAVACFGILSSNIWAITQTLAGPHASGKWTGIQNFCGNLAGVVAPALTGLVVDRTGQFFWAFAIASAVVISGGFSYLFVVGPIKEVEWASLPRHALAEPAADRV